MGGRGLEKILFSKNLVHFGAVFVKMGEILFCKNTGIILEDTKIGGAGEKVGGAYIPGIYCMSQRERMTMMTVTTIKMMIFFLLAFDWY